MPTFPVWVIDLYGPIPLSNKRKGKSRSTYLPRKGFCPALESFFSKAGILTFQWCFVDLFPQFFISYQ